jgi:hypothetical protein
MDGFSDLMVRAVVDEEAEGRVVSGWEPECLFVSSSVEAEVAHV